LKTFKQGEMWWEPPGTAHVVSRNASKKERAKLLVFSVGEQGAYDANALSSRGA
jgi:quercetin dioxygenase-like cupin family protein